MLNDNRSIEYQLEHLGESHEDRVDVIQEVLKFTKNIYAAYQSASPELKRHYLGFFWEGFDIEPTKTTVRITSRPGMVFRELLELQQAYLKNTPLEKTREYKEFSQVLIRDEMLPLPHTFGTVEWSSVLQKFQRMPLMSQ